MKNVKYTKKEISNFYLQGLIILTSVTLLGILSRLNKYFLIAIIVITLFVIPFLLKAFYKQKESFKKFDHLCNYLTNIIPVFMQKTKIRYTLGELFELCDGDVKLALNEAIEYIDNTKNDPELLKNGLKKIENHFNNSRVESVHKFLLSVETTNSETYKDIADNLNADIDNWIKRSYSFQKDLKNRQTKILLLCFATLVMNALFVYVYVSNEYFEGFVNNIYYQISTFIFTILVLLIIAFVTIRLTGEWLIEDNKNKDNEKLKENYRIYKQGKQKINKIDVIIFIVIIAIGIYIYYLGYTYASYIMLLIAILALSQKSRKYKNLKKSIQKELTIEFPMWLREVSLSLGNLTVLNAIENSLQNASYPLRREVRNFLNEASKNPSSIKPYNDFLDEYKIDETKASMRILYAVNSVSKSDMKDRVAKLINRNEVLLAKSEELRNYDSIGYIEAIGYVPTIFFSIHMIVSMMVMFDYMLGALGELI